MAHKLDCFSLLSTKQKEWLSFVLFLIILQAVKFIIERHSFIVSAGIYHTLAMFLVLFYLKQLREHR